MLRVVLAAAIATRTAAQHDGAAPSGSKSVIVNRDVTRAAALERAIYDVTTFGAKGDNATLDTAAFVAAIAAVEKAGGGTVLVPPPGIYLIAPINLTSNIDFHIADGARIVGVMNSKLWPIIPGAPSYGQGRNHGAHSPRFTSDSAGCGRRAQQRTLLRTPSRPQRRGTSTGRGTCAQSSPPTGSRARGRRR